MSRPQCETPGCDRYAYRFNGRHLCEECAQAAGLSACGTSSHEEEPIRVPADLGDMLRPVNSMEVVCELWNATHKRKMNRWQADRIAKEAERKFLTAFIGSV